MIRYRIPVIGGYLYRRDMARLGRGLAEAFQRGIDSVSPDVVCAIREAMTRPAPGDEEIASEDGIRWHQQTGPDD